MDKKLLIKNLVELIKPIVLELNYELYYVEFVKENRENYLRIYIDSPKGITLSDCEKVSRPVSNILDNVDLIAESYYLEVSSPGINRNLYTEAHFQKHINNTVSVHLKKSIENSKKIVTGILNGFDEDNIKIYSEENDIIISRDNIKSINLIEDL